MLGGLAPILIFSFPFDANSVNPVFNALSGIPLIGKDFATNVGVPIPLYLDENLTGLFVESENKAIDIETTIEPRFDGKAPVMTQKALNVSVTINLSDLAVPKLASLKYRISYLNGPTVILGGLLSGLTVTSGSDNDLMNIALSLQKSDSLGPPPNPYNTLAPVNGTVLGPTGVVAKAAT